MSAKRRLPICRLTNNHSALVHLDWTIVRFIAAKDKLETAKLKVTFGDTKISWGISRTDIADFLLTQMNDKQYIRSMPIIGS